MKTKFARLKLEPLEDRCTPATFTVNTVNDTVVSNAANHNALDANGQISLRSAIEQANFDGTGDPELARRPDITEHGEQRRRWPLQRGPSVVGGRLRVPQSNDAVDNGGGLYLDGGSATFNSVTFQANGAQKGAAAYEADGTLSLDSCTVQSNSASVLGNGLCYKAGKPMPTETSPVASQGITID